MAEQPKFYFRQYPGFRFTSGVKISKGADKGKTTDFGVLTGCLLYTSDAADE